MWSREPYFRPCRAASPANRVKNRCQAPCVNCRCIHSPRIHSIPPQTKCAVDFGPSSIDSSSDLRRLTAPILTRNVPWTVDRRLWTLLCCRPVRHEAGGSGVPAAYSHPGLSLLRPAAKPVAGAVAVPRATSPFSRSTWPVPRRHQRGTRSPSAFPLGMGSSCFVEGDEHGLTTSLRISRHFTAPRLKRNMPSTMDDRLWTRLAAGRLPLALGIGSRISTFVSAINDGIVGLRLLTPATSPFSPVPRRLQRGTRSYSAFRL